MLGPDDPRQVPLGYPVKEKLGIVITQPIGNCDGSGLYEYDPDFDNDEGRGAPLKERCPGCRACC